MPILLQPKRSTGYVRYALAGATIGLLGFPAVRGIAWCLRELYQVTQ